MVNIKHFLITITYILYSQKMYNKSLLVFQTLSEDETFSKIIPYYITQIFFSLEKYSDIIEYGKPLLENIIESRERKCIGLSQILTII